MMATGPAPAPRRVHPIDLLVLAMALGLAALCYAYLFRSTPVGRPAEPYLGMVLAAEFAEDQPWKREFAAEGSTLRVEDGLRGTVIERAPAPGGGAGRVRVRVRILGAGEQRPDDMLRLKKDLRLGSRVRLCTAQAEVESEIVEVVPPPGDR